MKLHRQRDRIRQDEDHDEIFEELRGDERPDLVLEALFRYISMESDQVVNPSSRSFVIIMTFDHNDDHNPKFIISLINQPSDGFRIKRELNAITLVLIQFTVLVLLLTLVLQRETVTVLKHFRQNTQIRSTEGGICQRKKVTNCPTKLSL